MPLHKFSLGIYIIQTAANLIFGDDYHQIDALRYPLLLSQIVDTAGVEVYSHYVQIFQSGKFQNYDHGKKKNLEVYGQPHPPAYNLSKVEVPVSLYVGENDWLATKTNAEQLYSELPASSRCGYHLVKFPKWNHIDFLIAKDVQEYLYQDVFNKIIEIDKEMCKI
ncbi:hypothetical protein NQ314_000101 [Rhamnusium bicolor]|uniref:Uncharacterized protein n=1 Tax=Rhamnusium bicolor TaxID=1586634 RepID=A0AAV8ZX31_9CUCU|nr:hypothetical protein NQ314_000101 [Rhamnusium bicolor]